MDRDGLPLRSELDTPLFRARLIALALGIAVMVYAALGVAIRRAAFEAPLADDASTFWIVRGAFTVVAFVNLATGAGLRRAVIEGQASLIKTHGELPRLGTRMLSATIVSGAFAEAVAVYGVVLTVLGGELVDVLLFGVVALVALAVVFPRRDEWEERARTEALLGL